MKNKTYMLNTLLAAVTTLYLVIDLAVRTFAPAAIMPHVSIPNLVLLSLTALLADHYLAPGAARCYICIPLFSVITFVLLPWAAGYASGIDLVKLGLMGGLVFTCTTWLFSSIADRLSTGPNAKLAPWISAFGLYLASQCFAGMYF